MLYHVLRFVLLSKVFSDGEIWEVAVVVFLKIPGGAEDNCAEG
jgi:hypothetical protein